MQIDTKTAPGGGQRNPEDSNFPTGIYLSRLVEVADIGPKKDDPGGAGRLVFEFTVEDGPYKGKTASTFVFKKLYPKPTGRMGKASKLYDLAKSLGVIDPMAGFDTDQFVGKHYQIGVKNEGDRAWVETVFPVAAPVPQAAAPARPNGPPPRPGQPPKPAPVAEPKCWYAPADGGEPREKTKTEIFELVRAGVINPADDPVVMALDGNEWVAVDKLFTDPF
jgi:hypothetical protein